MRRLAARSPLARRLLSRAGGRAYPGRIVFDHLEKTAGQAINAWLRAELGAGCVTPNMGSDHRTAICQYGGAVSVISGHITYVQGDTLDPRYDYLTVLREPLDRAVSWTYFLATEVVASDAMVAALVTGARQFIASGGREATPEFLQSVRNPYVEHFSKLAPEAPRSDSEKLAAARHALAQYRIVGFYEALPRFVAATAALVGISVPHQFAQVNKTRDRPAVSQLDTALRARLAELTALDRAFYAGARGDPAIERTTRRSWLDVVQGAAYWVKYAGVPAVPASAHPSISVSLVAPLDPVRLVLGQELVLGLQLRAQQAAGDIVIGVRIVDAFARLAFAADSRQLRCAFRDLGAGTWQATITVIADLPDGSYRAGYWISGAFAGAEPVTLARHDEALRFDLVSPASGAHSGYCRLEARMNLEPAA